MHRIEIWRFHGVKIWFGPVLTIICFSTIEIVMIASEEIWKSLEKLEMLDTYENIANYVKTV